MKFQNINFLVVLIFVFSFVVCRRSIKDDSDTSPNGGGGDTSTPGDTSTSTADYTLTSDETQDTEVEVGKLHCAEGYTCYQRSGEDVVWVLSKDGPGCATVCEKALGQNCTFHTCDSGRPVEFTTIESCDELASELGFHCRKKGCWDGVAPGTGLYLVSKETAEDGSKACYLPDEAQLDCRSFAYGANCFGDFFHAVCP